MAEMRLIDADSYEAKLTKELNKTGKYTAYESGLDDAIFYLGEQPTVDAAPVTRCNDCDHQWKFNGALYCNNERGPAGVVDPDHFCAFGKRGESN